MMTYLTHCNRQTQRQTHRQTHRLTESQTDLAVELTPPWGGGQLKTDFDKIKNFISPKPLSSKKVSTMPTIGICPNGWGPPGLRGVGPGLQSLLYLPAGWVPHDEPPHRGKVVPQAPQLLPLCPPAPHPEL